MRKTKNSWTRESKYILLFALLATITTSSVTYVTLNPPAPERFFATWIVGANGLAEDYFPNDNPNIAVGEQVNWTLGVYNAMSTLEYVVVRVKLLNSTIASPNETAGNPSPVPSLFEFTRVLLPNETWTFPFVWSMLNVTQRGKLTMIGKLSINGNTVNGALTEALLGMNFRFVFELWFYDENLNQFAFSWTTGNTRESAWTQVWFNVAKVVAP